MKLQRSFHLSKNLVDETRHYYDDGIVKIADQRFIRSQSLLQFTRNICNSLVKGIYAGFVMVENKCTEVDKEQVSQNASKFALNNSNTQI